jgi:hypothetical protein
MSRPATRLGTTGVKGGELSNDGSQLSVTFATKYVGDIVLTIPVSCVGDLIVVLDQQLGGAQQEATPSPIAVAQKAGPSPARVADDAESSAPRVSVPKNWAVAKDVKVPGGMVLLAFEPRTQIQTTYALHVGAAKELAAALIRQADAALAQRRKT